MTKTFIPFARRDGAARARFFGLPRAIMPAAPRLAMRWSRDESGRIVACWIRIADRPRMADENPVPRRWALCVAHARRAA